MQKWIWKLFTGLHVLVYRLSSGRVGHKMRDFQVLLLTTTGRKSGKVRILPLGYFEAEGGYVIIASNGGQESNPGWYYNLKSQPQVEIQVGNRRTPATAVIVEEQMRQQLWSQLLAIAPSYANYRPQTRHIPMVVLRPPSS